MANILLRSLLIRTSSIQAPSVGSINRFFSSPPPRPDFKPDIAYKELNDKLESRSVVLIDLRYPKELEKHGMVPGSINIPLPTLGPTMMLPAEDFAVRMGVPKPAASSPLVTMCLAGVRAKTAQLALLGAGYTNVRNYKGSFEDWVEKGGHLIKASEDDLK